MSTVLKHGSHNQKDHAGKGGGSTDLPEGWSKRDSAEVHRELVTKYMEHNPRGVAEAIANSEVDNYDHYSGPNGTTVKVEKPTLLNPGRRQLSEQEIRPTLEEVARLQSIAPNPGMTVTIGEQGFRDHGPQVAGFAGFAYRGKPDVFLRPRAVSPGLEPNVLMPSAAGNRERYGVTHEWGHTIDRRSSTQAAIDHNQALSLGGLSTYGRSDKYESYAECFAEWSLTGGRSDNPAVSYFSETYNWGSEGMAKAVTETVEICGDTFTAEGPGVVIMDRPNPAAGLRKSVTIAFAPGLRPVLKHGNHNQKDHGRKGGSLKPEVAASILERVKANGGLSVNMLDGSEPTKGFMVAKGGDIGDIVPADKFFDPVEGPKALGSFLKANRDTLTKGSYLGLWHNTEDGNVYLDVSDNILDRGTAERAGRERNQISIWDVANFQEINTGGTGELAKTASGDPDAGPVEDDGRGDRRLRPEGVGEVHRPGGIVVGFEPGFRPILKHGNHNQQSHAGGRGAARPDGAIDVQVGYKGLTSKGARFVTEEAEKRGLTMKALEDNYAARIEMAKTMPDPYREGLDAYEGGMTWYAAAGRKAVEVGDGDAERGAGMLSALSPQNPWPANVRAAEMVADMRRRKDELGLDTPEKAWAYYQANHSAFGQGTKGGCGPVTKPNFDMAWKIATGSPVASTLTGRKRQNFYNNILGDSRGVTVDVHMAKGMSMTPGSKVTGKKAAETYLTVRGATTGGAGYTFAAQAITNVANRYGIDPAQAQAIIWNTYVQVPWPKGDSGE